ncbi:hypothetical protein D3C85_1198250 [compost metagenome]
MSGVITVPDAEALIPTIPCMNKGTNIMAPNMPTAIRKPTPLMVEKVLFLNKRTGRIGSSALLSINMKAVKDTTARTNSPIICQEPQAYSLPPNVRARSKLTTPTIIVIIPGISNLTLPVAICFGNAIAIKITARIPTGRLM